MNMSPEATRVTFWTAVLLLLFLLAAGLAAYWHGRPDRHLAAAEECFDSGAVDEAFGWLGLPEATPRTRDRALLLHARAALERGRLSEAAGALERVDSAGPWATDLAFWKGRALYANRQMLDAVAWFRHVLERRPSDPEALRWLAAAAYDLGDTATVSQALRAVVRVKPDDVRAWRTLALVAKEQVDYEEALPAYVATLRLDPRQPKVRLEMAETLVKLGRYAEAERALAACRGGVAEADRLALLAECLIALDETSALRAVLDEGLAMAPDHPGLLAQRSRLDLAEGHPDVALGRLDRAVAADPYSEPCYYQRGLILRRLGRDSEADRDLARSRELKRDLAELSRLDGEASQRPADPDVRYRLGRLCTRVGKSALAASWFRAALACDRSHQGAHRALRALEAGLPLPPE